MKTKLLSATFFVVAISVVHIASAADWADLKMTITVKGTIPKTSEIVGKERDPFCAALSIRSELMLVNPKNNGIQNVALYVDTRKYKLKEIHPSLKEVPKNKVVLDNINCVFVPHVLVVRAGQTITVKNSDKTGHNANFSAFFANEPQNFTVQIGSSRDLTIKEPERGVCPVECGSHSWMKAHIIAQDHPYVGVSDADGVLKIEKLPAGKVPFRIWHENTVTAIDEVTLNGKKVKWDRASLELDLKPGANEFKVEVDAKKFK